jgi:hypothetical protein
VSDAAYGDTQAATFDHDAEHGLPPAGQDDPVLRGGPVSDERYPLVSHR